MSDQDLFNQLDSQIKDRQSSSHEYTQSLISNIDSEYLGATTINKQRQEEVNSLKISLAAKKYKLVRIKSGCNSGNPDRRTAIAAESSKKRKDLIKEIKQIEVRLNEISIETGEIKDDNTKSNSKSKTKLTTKTNNLPWGNILEPNY